MKPDGNHTIRKTFSRREFTKKSLLAIAALGTASIAGYGIINAKKLRTLNNYLRMGHCAPSVMQTLLEMNDIQNTSLVISSGAMSGGIAGPNMECGALTAPLMFMGFRKNTMTGISEKLDLICMAQSYMDEFTTLNGSCICTKIRQGGMPACTKVVGNFHKPFLKAVSNPSPLSDEAKKSYSLLLKAFDDNNFHCSHNVMNNINGNYRTTKEILDSSWVFIGGIALLNRTCGALAAGVLALSSVTAKIENSYSRVAKMNRLLRDEKKEALNDDINNFNLSINYSVELGNWFRKEFGSTTCYDICGFNFARIKDAEKYLSGDGMKGCLKIAEKVAQKVNIMI